MPHRRKTPATDDGSLCNAMIDRLGRLLTEAVSRAGADPTKDAVAQCINLAQQIGAWVDRRAKLVESNAGPGDNPPEAELPDLDTLETRFLQAIDDIRHARQSS